MLMPCCCYINDIVDALPYPTNANDSAKLFWAMIMHCNVSFELPINYDMVWYDDAMLCYISICHARSNDWYANAMICYATLCYAKAILC